MAGFLSAITERGATPALIATVSFNESRLRMLGENIANLHTPGYHAKQLDVRAFQGALKKALDVRRAEPGRPFAVRSGDEVRTDERGALRVTPRETPVENVLFHDGTNASLERQMADLTETEMAHDLAVTLLQDKFNTLRKAIRGNMV